jgi:hypothetical protein
MMKNKNNYKKILRKLNKIRLMIKKEMKRKKNNKKKLKKDKKKWKENRNLIKNLILSLITTTFLEEIKILHWCNNLISWGRHMITIKKKKPNKNNKKKTMITILQALITKIIKIIAARLQPTMRINPLKIMIK